MSIMSIMLRKATVFNSVYDLLCRQPTKEWMWFSSRLHRVPPLRASMAPSALTCPEAASCLWRRPAICCSSWAICSRRRKVCSKWIPRDRFLRFLSSSWAAISPKSMISLSVSVAFRTVWSSIIWQFRVMSLLERELLSGFVNFFLLPYNYYDVLFVKTSSLLMFYFSNMFFRVQL